MVLCRNGGVMSGLLHRTQGLLSFEAMKLQVLLLGSCASCASCVSSTHFWLRGIGIKLVESQT